MIKEFQGQYRWLSNFSPCKIVIDGYPYKSVEHAYMSCKNPDKVWKEFCQKTENPGTVKKMGDVVTLVTNWKDIKINVMRVCISQKFEQEPYKTLLLATGDQELQEDNEWRDTFWGVDLETGEGTNFLGQLIMAKRKDLQYWEAKRNSPGVLG